MASEAALQEMKLMSFFRITCDWPGEMAAKAFAEICCNYRLDELYKDPKSGIRA